MSGLGGGLRTENEAGCEKTTLGTKKKLFSSTVFKHTSLFKLHVFFVFSITDVIGRQTEK